MNFVYEQWLLADLRDVGEAYLPQNINEAEKLMLNGVYPLQVFRKCCLYLFYWI